MRIEKRYNGIVIVPETKEEIELVETAFGGKVTKDDGFIAERICHAAVADCYGPLYVFIPNQEVASAA